MIRHSVNVCDELLMHSMNKANESAAIFSASAAPMIVIQVMGLFHFMYVTRRHHPFLPSWLV